MKAIKLNKQLTNNRIFRNNKAQSVFIEMSKWEEVSEYGVNSLGEIYFKFIYGTIAVYSRREFIRLANYSNNIFNNKAL